MKKFVISIAALLALLLCCACGAQSAAEPAAPEPEYTEPTPEPTPEPEPEPKEIVRVYSSKLPDKYCGRLLSDEEIAALDWRDIDNVRAQISTVEDAVAWLSTVECSFADGANWTNSDDSALFWYPAVREIFGENYAKFAGGVPALGKDNVCMIAAWLLQDDMPEVGVFFAEPRTYNGKYGRTSVPWVTFLAIEEDEGTTLININALIPGNDIWMLIPVNGDIREEYNALLVFDLEAFAEQFSLIGDDGLGVKFFSDVVYINDFESDTEYTEIVDLGSTFTIRSGIRRLYSDCAAMDAELEEYIISQISKKNLEINQFRVYDYGDETICDALGDATINEAEAEKLNVGSIDEAAAKIRTLPDLMIYLHAGGFKFGRSDVWQRDLQHSDITWHFNVPAETSHEIKNADCGATAALATYMLQGDYEEIGFVCHTYPVGGGGGHVYNYIKHNGYYYVFDLTSLTGGGFNPGEFVFIRMKSLDEYAELYKDNTRYGYLPVIYAYNSLREIPMAWADGQGPDGTRTTWYPTGTELYIINEESENDYHIDYRDISDATLAEIERALTPGYANIGFLRVDEAPVVNLPKALSGATMSYEEAMELAHATSEEKAEKVKTVEDALLLFHAMGAHYGGKDLACQDMGGDVWHYNHLAQRALQDPDLGCGQTANSLRYLLDGDYEEVGIISCTWANGEGGGHVFNYILTGGKYYVVDFTVYTGSGFDPQVKAVLELDKIDDFAGKWQQLYGGNTMKVAYCHTLMSDLPVRWGGDDVSVTGIPDKYRDDVHIIFQTVDEGYVVEFVPLSDRLEEAINEYRSR